MSGRVGLVRLGLALVVLLTGIRAAASQTTEETYRTKGLTIVVGYAPGGVYDVYARLLARHIGRHLPGAPTVIVQNMPGAGSLRAANYVWDQAPKDGTQIATFASGLPMQPLIDPQGVRFDPLRMSWIGSAGKEVSIVIAWHTTPFRTVGDLQREQMVVPGTGGGANSVIFPRLLNAVLGTRFKLVTGYGGASETMLAIERGEAQGHVGGTWDSLTATQPEWIASGKVRILLQISDKRHPQLPDVPIITELAMPAADRQVLDMVMQRQSLARPYAAPPGTPADRIAALRRGFAAALTDKEFLAEAVKQKLEIDPVDGAQMEDMIRRVYASPPEIIERARAALLGNREPGAKVK